MAAPRQITDLPIATTANSPDLMLIRQGLFDKQITIDDLIGNYMEGSNNLSEVTDPATARANIGVDTSNLLQIANNLSDVASVATARTNLSVTEDSITAKLNATNNFSYNVQNGMQIESYSETSVALGAMGATQTFDLSTGNVFSGTASANVVITFSNSAVVGASSLFVIMTDGGDYAITWPASVKWPAATAPTLTSGGVDLLVFTTIDNGTTWYGALAGLALA